MVILILFLMNISTRLSQSKISLFIRIYLKRKIHLLFPPKEKNNVLLLIELLLLLLLSILISSRKSLRIICPQYQIQFELLGTVCFLFQNPELLNILVTELCFIRGNSHSFSFVSSLHSTFLLPLSQYHSG